MMSLGESERILWLLECTVFKFVLFFLGLEWKFVGIKFPIYSNLSKPKVASRVQSFVWISFGLRGLCFKQMPFVYKNQVWGKFSLLNCKFVKVRV